MEPMNLGSPGGSPASGKESAYLPSFLMGEPQPAKTPRSNTLSPNKGTGRSFGFANSPGNTTSLTDCNVSAMGQKSLFSGYQQNTPTVGNNSFVANNSFVGTPVKTHQVGPPTQELFDSLQTDRIRSLTPTFNVVGVQQNTPLHAGNMNNNNSYNLNQSFQQQTQFNDSYTPTGPNAYNASMRALCSPLGANMSPIAANMTQPSPPTPQRFADYWVTVYGFPPTAISMILQHFSHCGTIVGQVPAPHNGNWVHLKFMSRIECDKALNYDKKILNYIYMIGVTRCTDMSILDKENDNSMFNEANNVTQEAARPKVRSLIQQNYFTGEAAAGQSKSLAQKSTGIMNKAMDLFFGW